MTQQPPLKKADAGTGSLKVPPQVAKLYGPLVELIRQSESMNDEERQYWINILPVMTPEQVTNLTNILENERSQLRAIDAKYAEQRAPAEGSSVQDMETSRRQKRSTRNSAEQASRTVEDKAAEDLLRTIEQQGGTPQR